MSDDISSSTAARMITPSDTETFPAGRGLYVGVSGDVTYEDLAGNEITKVGMAAGVTHPMQCVRVLATGTTATDLVVEY